MFIIQVINIALDVIKIASYFNNKLSILHLVLSNWLQTFQLSITLPTLVGPEFQQ